MAYIGYSPWNDAANVGQGIGTALGNVLMQVPLLKRQMELEDRKLASTEAHQRAMEAYQIAAAGERAETMRLYMENRALDKIATTEYRTEMVKLRQQGQEQAARGKAAQVAATLENAR